MEITESQRTEGSYSEERRAEEGERKAPFVDRSLSGRATLGQRQRIPVMWKICGSEYSRECIVYFMRGMMLYMILIASVINLMLDVKPRELWIAAFAMATGGMGLTFMGNVITTQCRHVDSLRSLNS